MRKMKKFIGFAMAVCMIAVCLAACGNGSGNGSSSSSQSSQSAQQSSASKEDGSSASQDSEENDLGVWAPFPEEVTITRAQTELIIDAGFKDGEDIEHNVWTQRYHDLFNVNLESAWIVPDSEYNSKINMCIADNDLPDVFKVTSITQLRELAEAGMIMDITDVFDQYASDLIKSYMEAQPETAATAYVDGKMYGIPMLGAGLIGQIRNLWIRKDWRLENNLEAPETWEETVEMLRIFHDKYGATFGLRSDLTQLNYMGPIWAAYPATWIRTDNGVEYGGVQPEVKNMLADLNALYKEGLLDEEFVTWDYQKHADMVAQGKVGVFVEDSWYDYYYRDGLKAEGTFDTNKYAEAYALPSATGEKVMYNVGMDNAGYIVISSKCEHPEAVMKIVNLQPQVYYEGNEGAYGEIPEDVKEAYLRLNHTVVGFLRVYNPECDYELQELFAEAIATGDDSKITSKGAAAAGNWALVKDYVNWLADPAHNDFNKAVDGFTESMQKGGEHGGYEVVKKIIDDGDYFYNVWFGIDPESGPQLNGALSTILREGYTKIIAGQEPVDYFDELVETWKKSGGDQLTKEMNGIYGE